MCKIISYNLLNFKKFQIICWHLFKIQKRWAMSCSYYFSSLANELHNFFKQSISRRGVQLLTLCVFFFFSTSFSSTHSFLFILALYYLLFCFWTSISLFDKIRIFTLFIIRSCAFARGVLMLSWKCWLLL